MRNRVLIVLATLVPVVASAQSVVVARNVLSIQPLNAVFTAYSAEYEHRTGAAATLGVGGTYFDVGDGADKVIYKSGDVKLRYYPNGTGLMGFSVGGTAGYSTISGTDVNGNAASVSGPTLGVLLEYQWLLGPQHNFAVALGAGAKALFVKDSEISSDNFVTRYPTARISIGYAF